MNPPTRFLDKIMNQVEYVHKVGFLEKLETFIWLNPPFPLLGCSFASASERGKIGVSNFVLKLHQRLIDRQE